MVELVVSRRSYLLSRPSENAMRAAGMASASGARREAEALVRERHAQVLRNAGFAEPVIAAQTGVSVST